jgi:hypothetical protein
VELSVEMFPKHVKVAMQVFGHTVGHMRPLWVMTFTQAFRNISALSCQARPRECNFHHQPSWVRCEGLAELQMSALGVRAFSAHRLALLTVRPCLVFAPAYHHLLSSTEKRHFRQRNVSANKSNRLAG